MSYLILVRHGISEWNKLGIWTGQEDPGLHAEGFEDARKMAELIKDYKIDYVQTSKLKRTIQTADTILQILNILDIPREEFAELNERHYGIYTKKNKWEVKEMVGEEEFQKIRRSWDHPIPEGESLKQVYARVIPHFKDRILPLLKEGKNIMVSASGNSLRALSKELKNLTEEEIADYEMGLGEVHVYEFNENGEVIDFKILGENPDKGKV